MVKKVSKGTSMKRPKRAKDADKEVPASLNHIRHLLGPWGLDTRKFFKNPLALCSRGPPDATMSEPFYGWMRHGDDRDYQFTYTYGTRLEEPDDPPPSPTSAPNTPSSQVPVDFALDLQDNAPHRITSNEGDTGTPPTSINITTELIARPLTPCIMDVLGRDDSYYLISPTTTPGSLTSSNGSAPYLRPYDPVNCLSDEMTLYPPPNPTPPEYPPSAIVQGGLYPSNPMSTPAPYVALNSDYLHHPPTQGVDQPWSQPIDYPSYPGTYGFPQSAPPTQITYHRQNMDDHSLAPVIPHVSVGHNVPGVPPIYDPIDRSFHANNIVGPSRPTRARQSSNRPPNFGGSVPYDSGRRMHPIPLPARNSQPSCGFPVMSDLVYNYDLDTSHLGNDLNLTIGSLGPFATLNTDLAATYTQDNGTSDGMPRWGFGHSVHGFLPQ
ncbi:hypothetical protein BDZ94DRAFT_1298812 [Collybia nuda]|uniref:Uncharacterized protein n=1 Tax=Collybia nuda TaxID=64659 RepID=A0A9P5Y6F3_9AGAR|nr:hypothetical protein BDZ94DRAFT_1298812 [Collybia nuda]